jgi:hypothetical protein
MALVIADRVKESSTTSGTGTITLGGAVTGYQAFTAIGNGNQCYYTIVNIAVATEWEVGVGTYSSSTLTRDTVLSSSNSGAKVSFSAGNKEVFVTYPADRSVSQADIGTAPNEIPLNQYLGSLAYQDLDSVTINGGNATLDVATITAIQNDTAISNVQPSLNLDFANVKKLDPRITYARASEARYYDGKTVSKAEENLLLQSQTFDNASWIKSSVTITPNVTTAPDGTTTADSVIPTTANSVGHRITSTNASIIGASVLSWFVKPAGYSKVAIRESTSTGVYASFNLTTATVIETSASLVSDATITVLPNGWYRISAVITYTGNTGNSILVLDDSYVSGNPYSYEYAGDGTSGVYIWGAQLEQRSAVSSYTPTTTQAIINYQPTLLTASANVARFDHDPVTNESLGLLIEEQRTNLVLRSEEFDNGGWSKVNSPTITANANIAPNGTQTADLYIAGSTAGARIQGSVTIASSTTYTLSVYAKKYTTDYICFGISGVTAGIFNLMTGEVSNSAGLANSLFIKPSDNGWYRCSLTFTATASGGAVIFGAVSTPTFTSGTYANNTEGDSCFIWGAQLEAGAFPTSYIPTVASQVTRSADSASMTGANFSSWYRADEGSFYMEANSTRPLGSFLSLIDTGVGSSTANRNTLVVNLNAVNYSSINNGVVDLTTNTSNFRTADPFKVAYSAQDNSLAVCLNGGVVATDTSGTLLKTVDNLKLGVRSDFGIPLNGTIKKLSYYPQRLSNEELQEMTS